MATTGSPRPARQACDACRQRKRRCVLLTLAQTTTGRCHNCERAGSRCTFLLPLRTRGPKRKTDHDQNHQRLLAWRLPDTSSSTTTYATDILCPRELVRVLVDDYVRYIYPLLPVVHLPSFTAAVDRGRDADDGDLLALAVSLCAATVALLPSRLGAYREHPTAPLPFRTRAEVAGHCYRLHLGFRRDTHYFDTVSHARWASSYLLGIAFHQAGNINLWRMLEVEAMQLLRLLEVHHPPAYRGLDPVEAQLRKKAFWLMFYGYVHEAHNLRRERLTFLDPVLLGAVNLDDLIPAPLDDHFITPRGFLPCPADVSAASLAAGFNIHSRVFSAALGFAPVAAAPACCCQAQAQASPRSRLAELREQHRRLKHMLDTVVPTYAPPYHHHHHHHHDNDSMATSTIQRESIRANIHVTHLWLQSALLDQIDALQQQQQQPVIATTGHVSWDEREDICRQLLHTVHSISFSGLEANGLSLVYKIRDVASTLLAYPFDNASHDDDDDRRDRRAAEHLRDLSSLLSRLDVSETPSSLSLQSWVDTSRCRPGRHHDDGDDGDDGGSGQ
ncbi:uncharacterized protein B0I36DRAFT_293333 [Microdochium trichocladiopsis]|uniref:Zn(2)-C6 fungal-type domain-containing protein n=1 Tax=Microdochium trichocladiopsis TaxID=1682393 RepID=A0A9P8Y205_9PEZI|nr:uncharacterized protein B0I36DRAFT_293333 [Microdochium trichocladiopsis]KAH7025703.1 hypothetical protein B0I36DRAFT_293333 [Microdochium trichocladiopsis]